jgi:DNA-binding NarL/FixJ family response regulator
MSDYRRFVTSTGPAGATVLLVDDHPVVRRGMAALLQDEPWVARLVEAGSVADAMRAAVVDVPDVAVVDLGLPDGDGLGLIRRLRTARPDCAVLVLTMTRDPDVVRACLEAGAGGYLLKESAAASLLVGLRTVLAGGVFLGPRIGTDALARLHRDVPAPFDVLTARELRHVTLLATGSSAPEIARALGVSEKTVRNQMASILPKIGVVDRVQAALLARDSGLLSGQSG